MKNVFGNDDTIKRARSASAGDKSVYINWDAIEELPDEYEVVVTEVRYDAKNLDTDFTNVGSQQAPSWYPRTQLMYRIGEACGVSGDPTAESVPLTEDVDINPMLCKPMDDAPTYRRMTVGRSVSKRSSRLMEDGSPLWSSLCTAEYNAYERCLELWSKEEMYTDGYAKKGKFPNKYENRFQRRAHFDSEMKHAHAKAETKAHIKTIRELAGLPTGFSTSDLKSGVMIFARVRRSRKVLQMETAARLSALSRGALPESPAAQQLFGPDVVDDNAPEHTPADVDFPETEPEPEDDGAEPTIQEQVNQLTTEQEVMALILSHYKGEGLIVNEQVDTAERILAWLAQNPNITSEDGKPLWGKAKKILGQVEDAIPAEGRLTHGLK